mgnify:CR=1 FL=1
MINSQPQPGFYPQQPYGSQMAGNQVMPGQPSFQLDPSAIVARLNNIRMLASSLDRKHVSERTLAIHQLPNTIPVPLRFVPAASLFLCKKCGYKGITRVDIVPELNDKAKKTRCCALLIPLPCCWMMGLGAFCPGTPCRDAWSDRKHVCPQCENEAARWIALSPAAEVNQQEVVEALERLKIDSQLRTF